MGIGSMNRKLIIVMPGVGGVTLVHPRDSRVAELKKNNFKCLPINNVREKPNKRYTILDGLSS